MYVYTITNNIYKFTLLIICHFKRYIFSFYCMYICISPKIIFNEIIKSIFFYLSNKKKKRYICMSVCVCVYTVITKQR